MSSLRITFSVVSAFALSLAAGAADEAKPKSPEVLADYDVVYAKAGDTELKLDVVRPAQGDGPFPAVLAIHGGAWRQGDKKDTRQLLLELARRGYVAVSPQYRFCPKDTFPAQVHDVKAAVRFVKAHAKDYKLDPDRVGAVGFSAGAHLAMMLGVTGPEDGLEGDAPADAPSTKVRAVVNYFGPTDLRASDMPRVSQDLIKDFLGGAAEEKTEAAAKASPVTYVSQGDAPILSFHGTKDPLVPHTQATKLADAQTKAGVPGRVELLLGFGHGWGGEDLARTAEETYRFLEKSMK
jgi:acetyl esterase/lipase